MPTYEFTTEDVEYLRHGDRRFMARLFKPQGAGPFPVVVEVHGGAWCNGDLNECQIYAEGFARAGLAVVAISANDIVSYPDDAPGEMARIARLKGFTFPYLYDESQEVAKAYQAVCTPDFFLFDRDRRLAYRGQFDASSPGNSVPVTGADLRAACDALLGGKPLPRDQKPSVGCSIKWKPGQEPDWT